MKPLLDSLRKYRRPETVDFLLAGASLGEASSGIWSKFKTVHFRRTRVYRKPLSSGKA